MKQIITIFFIFSIFISNAKDFRTNFNIGIPLNKSINLAASNFDIDLLFCKNISDKLILGVGSSYLEVDLLPSKSHLTFDRKILSIYSTFAYELNTTKRLKLLPQFRLGYSIINSELNEFQDKIQKSGGFYCSQDLNLIYSISKRFDFLVGLSYSVIFSQLKTSPDLIITYNYVGIDKKTINQFSTKIGCIFHF